MKSNKLWSSQLWTQFSHASAVQYMIYFIYHLIIHSFLTGSLEPANDQWLLERRTGIARSRVQTVKGSAIAKIARIIAHLPWFNVMYFSNVLCLNFYSVLENSFGTSNLHSHRESVLVTLQNDCFFIMVVS